MPKLRGFRSVPIPGPRPSRLLGHYPALIRFLDDPVGTLTALREYGDVVAIARDNPALVCVFGAERNRQILSHPRMFHHNEDFIRGRAGTPLGSLQQVIVNINGEHHKRHRRLMMPAFAKSALDDYAEQVVQVSEAMVDRWPIGETVDLDDLLRDLTLGVDIRCLFGLNPLNDTSEVGEITTGFLDALADPLSILLPYELPGLPYRRAQHFGGRLLVLLDGLIAQKRAGGSEDSDALARLIHAVDDDGARFSDDELLSETTSLFFAGHDTMAKTMSWTMFLLERHPRVLGDLLDELDGVLGGRSISAADIPQLPLLDRVIKESMRVLSSVPILFLRVLSDDAEVGGITLPRQANVVVSPFATHHDPELYPNPRHFDPERWVGLEPSIYEYMPFGAGPRLCIGAAFARQALPLMLATVLQRTSVSMERGANVSRLTRANIMRPRYGLPARLHPPGTRTGPPEPVRGDVLELVELPAA